MTKMKKKKIYQYVVYIGKATVYSFMIYILFSFIKVVGMIAKFTTTFLENLNFDDIPIWGKFIFILFTWYFILSILSILVTTMIRIISLSDNELKEYEFLKLVEKYKVK